MSFKDLKSELSQLSEEALRDIQVLPEVRDEDCLVCFHFQCPEDAEADRWGDSAICVQRSRPLFWRLPYNLEVDGVGGSSGIEVWEKVRPSREWAADRITVMLEIADQTGMIFRGWSFEPIGGHIVSAVSGFQVGSMSAEELIDYVEGSEDRARDPVSDQRH